MGKVIQIMPADGWYAVYQMSDNVLRSKLVCWAIDDEGNLAGFDADDVGFIDDAGAAENFVRFEYEGGKNG